MSMYEAINGFVEEKLMNLHTAMPCKVLSYENNEATIQPLFMKTTKDGQRPYPIIEGVRGLKNHLHVKDEKPKCYCTTYYPGDIVLVIFSERALDHVLNGEIADPQFNRRHSIQDAIILGVIQ